MKRKGCESKRQGPNLRYYPDNFLENLRKQSVISRQRSPVREVVCVWFQPLLLALHTNSVGRVGFAQLLKKLSAFYGTRRYNIDFSRTDYLSLFRARQIQSASFYPISLRCILIFLSQLLPRYSQWGFCFRFSDRIFTYISVPCLLLGLSIQFSLI